MTRPKAEVRLVVFRSEKGQWETEAKKYKLRLSQFVRMIVNGKLRIPTEDLVRKVEKPKPEQMSFLNTASDSLRALRESDAVHS